MPFQVGNDKTPSYRLFFGERRPDGSYSLRTVSENGKAPFTVVGPQADPEYRGRADDETPNTVIAPFALPLQFHPAGNMLIWEDGRKCLHKIVYRDNWDKSEPFATAECGHTATYAPNGIATIDWQPGASRDPHPWADGQERRPARSLLSMARSLLSIESGRLAPDRPAMLFTIERHVSPIDDEDGPRPYVYDVTSHGLVARWRGSALAWPLLDATLIEDAAGRAYVCALHRGDSFVMLNNADPAEPRTQVYAWNGFGFSGVADGDLTKRCAGEFGGRAE